MANPEHVAIVKQGAEAIRAWRAKGEECRLDLREADLRHAGLNDADLRSAMLTEANLIGADLRRANLSRANLNNASLSNADLSNADLRSADLSGAHFNHTNLTDADLTNANLSGALLTRANLDGTILSDAELNNADLAHANLRHATLVGAILRNADLSGGQLLAADLRRCDLTDVDFSNADLSGADLSESHVNRADLHDARLAGVNVEGAHFGGTVLATDLSETHGLTSVWHSGPSVVSVQALAKSQGRIPASFLRGCGLSDWEIIAARLYRPNLTRQEIDEVLYEVSSLRAGAAIQLSPLFISYSHGDSAFVHALEIKLNEKGIRFWRDIHDIKAGRVEKQLTRAISLNPTVLLVLSKTSVESDWVEWEAAKARELEKELKHDVLCPVALDGAWKTCSWPGPLRRQIEDYHILDFSGGRTWTS